ncbi:hypothetical protein D3C73_1013260 [compost metagenome]
MVGIGADNVLSIIFGIRLVGLLVQRFCTIAVQCQLFAAVNRRLIVFVEALFGLSHAGQMTIHPRDQTPAAKHRHRDPNGGDRQHLRR